MCLEHIKDDAILLQKRMNCNTDDCFVYKIVGMQNGMIKSPLWLMQWTPGIHRAVSNYSDVVNRHDKPQHVRRGIRNNCILHAGIHVFLAKPNISAVPTLISNLTLMQLKVKAKNLIGANLSKGEAVFTHVELEITEWERIMGKKWKGNN